MNLNFKRDYRRPDNRERAPKTPFQKQPLILGIALVMIIVFGGGFFLLKPHTSTPQTKQNPSAVVNITATPDPKCPHGNLKKQEGENANSTSGLNLTDLPVTSGNALTLTLSDGQYQTVALLAPQNVNGFACQHDIIGYGASTPGEELLILREVGRNSIDIIITQGNPIIKVVSLQEADQMAKRYTSTGHTNVFDRTNYQQCTQNQGKLP